MIYAAADLHLCRHVWRSRKDLEGDSFRALQAFGDAVINDKTSEPKTIILAGDLFDAKKVDGPTLEAFCYFVERMTEKGIPVRYIQGNHEYNDDAPIAESCGAVGFSAGMIPNGMGSEIIDGRNVVGIDYCSREELLARLEALGKQEEDVHLLVLHCAMEHLVGYAGACDLKIPEIPENVKNVLVGDIHVSHKQPLAGRGYCVSPGPLHPTTITQGGPKGFFKLHATSESYWEFVEIPSREIYREEISTLEELNALPAMLALPEDKKDWPIPILELKYAEDLEKDVDAFIKTHGNKLAVIFDSSMPAPVDTDIPDELESVEALSLEVVLPYVLKDPTTLDLGKALASRPDDAERILVNWIDEELSCDKA